MSSRVIMTSHVAISPSGSITVSVSEHSTLEPENDRKVSVGISSVWLSNEVLGHVVVQA